MATRMKSGANGRDRLSGGSRPSMVRNNLPLEVRGSPLAFRTRTLGAPHARGDGIALNGRAAALQRQLNRARALRGLLRKPDNPPVRGSKRRSCSCRVPDPSAATSMHGSAAKERELGLLKRGVQQHREAAWKKWVREKWSTRPGALYAWVKQDALKPTLANLHCGHGGPWIRIFPERLRQCRPRIWGAFVGER